MDNNRLLNLCITCAVRPSAFEHLEFSATAKGVANTLIHISAAVAISFALHGEARAWHVLGVQIGGSVGEFVDKRSHEATKVLQPVGEAIARPLVETAKWVDKNPVAAVGIATSILIACADGCSIAFSAIAGSGSVVIYEATLGDTSNSHRHSAHSHQHATPTPSPVTAAKGDNDGDTVDGTRGVARLPAETVLRAAANDQTVDRNFTSGSSFGATWAVNYVYPKAFLRREDDLWAKPRRAYVSIIDDPWATNKFDHSLFGKSPDLLRNPHDTPPALHGPAESIMFPNHPVRIPSRTDPVGGIFSSGRKDAVPEGARNAWGAFARRTHRGLDLRTVPDAIVTAPMTGTIVLADKMPNKNGLEMIVIQGPDGTLARTLYAKLNPELARELAMNRPVTVTAGQPFGRAQDISVAYGDTPNHVHIDFEDGYGRRFNPFTREMDESDALNPQR